MPNANTAIIDRLVDAYNPRDARAFANFFTPDAIHGNLHAADTLHGRDAIYARYVDVFKTHPENHSDVVHRIAFGNYVITSACAAAPHPNRSKSWQSTR